MTSTPSSSSTHAFDTELSRQSRSRSKSPTSGVNVTRDDRSRSRSPRGTVTDRPSLHRKRSRFRNVKKDGTGRALSHRPKRRSQKGFYCDECVFSCEYDSQWKRHIKTEGHKQLAEHSDTDG